LPDRCEPFAVVFDQVYRVESVRENRFTQGAEGGEGRGDLAPLPTVLVSASSITAFRSTKAVSSPGITASRPAMTAKARNAWVIVTDLEFLTRGGRRRIR
jgi:hypothetical protein